VQKQSSQINLLAAVESDSDVSSDLDAELNALSPSASTGVKDASVSSLSLVASSFVVPKQQTLTSNDLGLSNDSDSEGSVDALLESLTPRAAALNQQQAASVEIALPPSQPVLQSIPAPALSANDLGLSSDTESD